MLPRQESRKILDNAFYAITAGIRVGVQVFYLEDQSKPEASHFVWAYRVTIDNQGHDTVQLLKRTWKITDAYGRVAEVHGDGVIGEQPIIKAGESFEYTSGTPLATPSGFMTGQYHMIKVMDGAAFDIAIPTFSLDSPHQNTRLH